MNRYLLLPLLLLCSAIQAQDYQPFVAGKLHYFASAKNYSVRIDSVGLIGGDSAFWMNAIATPPSANCAADNHTHFVPDQEGLFGDHFIRRPAGRFDFVSRAGDTAVFQTMVPLLTPWSFLSDSSLTAEISLRGQISIGGVLDSMVVIDLSDGRQFRLTQHYGMYLGPNLSYYLRSDSLRFSTASGRPLVPDFKDFFQWQPGDDYSTWDYYSPFWDKYARYEILSRSVNAAGDSLTFSAKRRHSEYWNPNPDTIYPPDTIQILYTREQMRFLEMATDEPYMNASGYHRQREWTYNPEFLNHKTLHFDSYPWPGIMDSCGYSYSGIAGPCVDARPVEYTAGIGKTYSEYEIGQTMTSCLYGTYQMLCYEQAGHDSLLPCPAVALLLDLPDPMEPAKLRLWRNSQDGKLGVQWSGLAPGTYRWTIHDLNGTLQWQEEKTISASGRSELPGFPVHSVYLLRIQNLRTGAAYALKVPMVGQ